jgi:hypothetical protein
MHALSVKIDMHRTRLRDFFMPNSAMMARAHREPNSIDFDFGMVTSC